MVNEEKPCYRPTSTEDAKKKLLRLKELLSNQEEVFCLFGEFWVKSERFPETICPAIIGDQYRFAVEDYCAFMRDRLMEEARKVVETIFSPEFADLAGEDLTGILELARKKREAEWSMAAQGSGWRRR